MDRYIGLDAHTQSCTFAVVGPSGRKLKSAVVETNGAALVEFIKLVPGRRHLCLEEGTQSQWLYELLSPHTDRTVVVVPERRKGHKSDASDAWERAEELRTGKLPTTVFKAVGGSFTALRELARVYRMINGDLVRTKNRLKSLFRSRGVSCAGASIYRKGDGRDAWLQKLPKNACGGAAILFEALDGQTGSKARVKKELLTEARKHPIASVLKTAPGVGEIGVAQILPIVVTPYRFRTRKQFWAYCGLGIVTHSSSDWQRAPNGDWIRGNTVKTRGLNRNRNATLKSVFKTAAMAIVRNRKGPLYEHYERLLEGGTKPNLAKLTIARRVAAIILAMWKSNKKYEEDYDRTLEHPKRK